MPSIVVSRNPRSLANETTKTRPPKTTLVAGGVWYKYLVGHSSVIVNAFFESHGIVANARTAEDGIRCVVDILHPVAGQNSHLGEAPADHSWIDLPIEDRPQLILAYEPSLDQSGHATGPGSARVDKTLEYVDTFARDLQTELKARNLMDIADVAFVSDHGVTDTSHLEMVYFDDLLGMEGLSEVEHIDGWPSVCASVRAPTKPLSWLARLEKVAGLSNRRNLPFCVGDVFVGVSLVGSDFPPLKRGIGRMTIGISGFSPRLFPHREAWLFSAGLPVNFASCILPVVLTPVGFTANLTLAVMDILPFMAAMLLNTFKLDRLALTHEGEGEGEGVCPGAICLAFVNRQPHWAWHKRWLRVTRLLGARRHIHIRIAYHSPVLVHFTYAAIVNLTTFFCQVGIVRRNLQEYGYVKPKEQTSESRPNRKRQTCPSALDNTNSRE
ncbi:hypothetical protein FISHEDRAFT_59285 [Fistulina hepatica ATCC 64428]|uniref:Uncharacterized protein n=1 Tax=Fistulina hepatica ATCC 64428 TaxID=1128425 RepID=A0A0D7ABA4_9AGAR|nr:hypothetical protein FISHEDRAFT_59285 [Fistulina hepatica ATCC 64428]